MILESFVEQRSALAVVKFVGDSHRRAQGLGGAFHFRAHRPPRPREARRLAAPRDLHRASGRPLGARAPPGSWRARLRHGPPGPRGALQCPETTPCWSVSVPERGPRTSPRVPVVGRDALFRRASRRLHSDSDTVGLGEGADGHRCPQRRDSHLKCKTLERDFGRSLKYETHFPMATVGATSTMRVLGAGVHMQSDQEFEFASVLAKSWAAFHANSPLWRTKERLHAKLRVLHLLAYACHAWASRTRLWTAAELQQVKSMQVKMTRGVARWYQDCPTFARRCAHWS